MSLIERTEDIGGPEGTLIYDRRTMSNALRSDSRGGGQETIDSGEEARGVGSVRVRRRW
jgi:hypothetical protein